MQQMPQYSLLAILIYLFSNKFEEGRILELTSNII